MPSLTTRINLTGDYATAVENESRLEGVSQAEIVRRALRAYWGESLENAPLDINGSPVQPTNRSTVQPSTRSTVQAVAPAKAKAPSPDSLFSRTA